MAEEKEAEERFEQERQQRRSVHDIIPALLFFFNPETFLFPYASSLFFPSALLFCLSDVWRKKRKPKSGLSRSGNRDEACMISVSMVSS
jgi:hypothetical protein